MTLMSALGQKRTSDKWATEVVPEIRKGSVAVSHRKAVERQAWMETPARLSQGTQLLTHEAGALGETVSSKDHLYGAMAFCSVSETVVYIVVKDVPMVVRAVMAATETSAAINPYSMAVAAFSSRFKRTSNFPRLMAFPSRAP